MRILTTNNESDPRPVKPVVLLLLDGWGIAPVSEANAISAAKTPTLTELTKEYPVALLTTGDKSLNARYLSIGSGSDLANENINPAATLSRVISGASLKQIKITETERLAALTYFFNGRSDNKPNGEDWEIVSSEVGQDRLKLDLASNLITKGLIKNLKTEKYSFLAVALPSLDLAAATGDLKIIKKAIEGADKNLRKIVDMVLAKKGTLIISAAGGNVENIKNMATELVDKEMTDSPVFLIIVGEDFKGKTIGLSEPLNNDLSLLAPAGNLGDLAPTILDIMNLSKPGGMTGESLIDKR